MNKNNIDIITDVIRNRRSVHANEFIKPENGFDKELLTEILTNAIWAPNHKMTEPWKFIVIKDEFLKDLGDFMSSYYKDFYLERFGEEDALKKCDSLKEFPLNSFCVLGIVLVRDEEERIPEWEEIAAVSSAVQNIALTCKAYDLGSYWSTSKGAIEYLNKFNLKENETSLGLVYIGYCDWSKKRKAKRTPLGEKVVWL